ncbi:MAG TPA: hypothetical protein PK916_07350 [Bacteroidota bacterium]|nr:hypothetical protein [Bacteroidota bacterium]
MLFRTIFSVVLLFASVTFTACDKSDSGNNPDVLTITDVLPKENEISGWARISGSQWKATNPSELQAQINGGSELYTNHGFVEAAAQSYSGSVNAVSGVSCDIQVYDQGSESNANTVFDDPNNVFVNPITPANPPSAKAQIRKDLFSWTMKFVKGRYYVLLSILSSDDKAQDVITVFANNVAGKIK